MFRFAQDTGLIRAERQSNEAFMCQMEGNNTDCLPAEITSAPTSLVNCLLGNELVSNIISRCGFGNLCYKSVPLLMTIHGCFKTTKMCLVSIWKGGGGSSLNVLKLMK